jgi:hypothetical protein
MANKTGSILVRKQVWTNGQVIWTKQNRLSSSWLQITKVSFEQLLSSGEAVKVEDYITPKPSARSNTIRL